MLSFLERFGDKINGILNGFDRIRFRGTKRLISNSRGLHSFLWQIQSGWMEFKDIAKDITTNLRTAIEKRAEEVLDAPVHYVDNLHESKQEIALRLAAEHHRESGLLAVLKCVEPCQTIQVRPELAREGEPLRSETGRCLHYYHYYLDPKLGLCNTRLQTWFPFTMHVCLNGREWLARQMDAAGIRFVKHDNCFTWIEDFDAAQKLMDEQLRSDWPLLLDELGKRHNPLWDRWLPVPVPYYWSVQESEWASDIAFRTPEDLQRLFPQFVRHGIENLHSGDVMRFFGYKVPAHGKPDGRFQGEVRTSLKELEEGVRVKHGVKGNTLKMYNKPTTVLGVQPNILRVEPCLLNVGEFKTYRPKEGDESGEKQWRPMRKGIADLHRRAEVSQKINERYFESLATVADRTPLAELTKDLGKPTCWHGRRSRALNPLAPEDVKMLETISQGDYLISGFRNRDLRQHWYGDSKGSKVDQRRQSAAVTRKLQLWRARGVIEKVQGTHQYRVRKDGHQIITALLAARRADTKSLCEAA